jgi:uncharacterized membrane protein (UPF0127 family)
MKGGFSQRGLLLAALAISIIGVFFVLSSAQISFFKEEGELTHLTGTLPVPSSTISAASTTIAVELAETSSEHAQGLSGRATLDADKGMLFIFDHAGQHSFWMPDMHFAIDIIWIDADWRIVHIAGGVTPESYPASFTPDAPALYVLEVNAGKAATWGWKVGTQFVFSR